MMPLTERRRKAIAALAQKKYRARTGEVLVEGLRAVASAVAAGVSLVEVLVTEAALARPDVAALVAPVAVPVHRVPERVMAQVSDVKTAQGVLAVARSQWTDPAALTSARRVLLLDGVQDPGNVGTLLRTAAWFGIEAVVAGAGTADVFSPKVIRASMGGVWDVQVAQVPDAAAWLTAMQGAGFACYGADLDGTPAHQWQPTPPAILVLGSEAHGLSPAVRACLDATVALPGASTRRATESLNVAVAGGILLYQWPGA